MYLLSLFLWLGVSFHLVALDKIMECMLFYDFFFFPIVTFPLVLSIRLWNACFMDFFPHCNITPLSDKITVMIMQSRVHRRFVNVVCVRGRILFISLFTLLIAF